MHKKIIAVIMVVAILVGMVGCSKTYTPYDYDLSKYITLGDYKENITYTYSVAQVTEQDIQQKIQEDMKEKGYGEDVTLKEGKVANGDTVVMDFTGYMNNKKVDSATATDYSQQIGAGTLIPGFESGLVGAEIGKEVTLNLTFPENYGNEEFNGKPVVFKVVVKSLTRTKYPDLTVDMLKELSDKKTIEEYRTAIQKELEEENLTAAQQKKESDIWEAVKANAKLVKEDTYPEDAINENVDYMTNYYTNIAKQSDKTLEAYVTESFGITLDEFNSTIKEMAKQTVFEEMVYYSIARKEGISFTDEQIDKKAKEYVSANSFPSLEAFYEVNPKYKVEQLLIVENVMKLLVENAKDVTKK